MFALHETTRMRLCRAAFAVLCLLPTCAVIAGIAVVHTGAYRQGHERAIAQRLGWQVRLAAVSMPEPHRLLYEGLELSDPATGQALARLPFVEIDTSGDALAIALPYPATINGARLDAFWQLIDELARAWPEAKQLRVEAQNLTVHLPTGDQSFTDVVAHFDGDAARTQGKLSFRRAIAGARTAEPCLLAITRRRNLGAADPVVQLTTGATPLPAALFASIWSGAAQVGKTCEFTGRITATRNGTTWRTELAGDVVGIDLDWLVSRQFPHKLSGLADAQIESVQLVGARIETARGTVTAGPGVISRSLVQSAETHLHVHAAPHALRGPGNLIAYKQLNLGFEIDQQGMTLRGGIPGTKGAILADARYVLAVQPPVVGQPVVDLVRTLVPQSDVHVPATRETMGLASTLPVPSIVMRPGTEEPLPHARPVSVNPLRAGDTIRR